MHGHIIYATCVYNGIIIVYSNKPVMVVQTYNHHNHKAEAIGLWHQVQPEQQYKTQSHQKKLNK
jgi:hypothetical protein